MAYNPYALTAPAGLNLLTQYPSLPFVTPEMFFLKTDADDTASIIRASAAVGPTGYVTLFGKTYNISSQIAVSDGTHGAGFICPVGQATFKWAALGSTFDAMTIFGAGYGTAFYTASVLQNLTLDCGGNGRDALVYINGFNDRAFGNLKIFNSGRDALVFHPDRAIESPYFQCVDIQQAGRHAVKFLIDDSTNTPNCNEGKIEILTVHGISTLISGGNVINAEDTTGSGSSGQKFGDWYFPKIGGCDAQYSGTGTVPSIDVITCESGTNCEAWMFGIIAAENTGAGDITGGYTLNGFSTATKFGSDGGLAGTWGGNPSNLPFYGNSTGANAVYSSRTNGPVSQFKGTAALTSSGTTALFTVDVTNGQNFQAWKVTGIGANNSAWRLDATIFIDTAFGSTVFYVENNDLTISFTGDTTINLVNGSATPMNILWSAYQTIS